MGKLNISGDLDIYNYLSASNTNLYLSSASEDYSIRFRIGDTEKMRLSPAGCLNINSTQTSASYKLYVNGTSCFNGVSYLYGVTVVRNSQLGASISFISTKNTDNKITGQITYFSSSSSSSTAYDLGSFYFMQYSYASGTYNRVEYYDRFYLPRVAADKTTNNDYQILTSKNVVTVAQGGTGRSTLTSGYALVGNGTSAVSLREITTSATSGSTALITSGAVYSKCANYLPLTGGTLTGNLIINANLTIGTLGSNTYRQFTLCRGTNNGTMWMAGISGGDGGTLGVSNDDGIQNQMAMHHAYTAFKQRIEAPRVIATNSTDAASTSNNEVALVTGPPTGQHLEFDGNEIISKTNATTGGVLYLNSGGTYIQVYNVVGNKNQTWGSTLPTTAAATGQIFFKI